jgi:hypothetical protein
MKRLSWVFEFYFKRPASTFRTIGLARAFEGSASISPIIDAQVAQH